MKWSMNPMLAALAVLLVTPLAARAVDPLPPPSATWAGTTDIPWLTTGDGRLVVPLRVGIVAYCADMAHNAGDTGLQANKPSVKQRRQKAFVQALSGNLAATAFEPDAAPPLPGAGTGPWFLDGPFDFLGQLGAQNLADYFAYDDGIDRLRDVQVIDGDLTLPTATQLIQNFDIVIAYTDNKCGQPIPPGIANAAASALAGFVASPGKKLILTGFAFSSSIGFGNAIFGGGLSPLRKGGPGLAACSRGEPCPIGTCPAGCAPAGSPPQCFDAAGSRCPTAYTPSDGTSLGTNNGDLACDQMLANVLGPTSSSWATALTEANVAPGASLCLNYDVTPAVPFLAINQARNIIAVNAFPPDAADVQKFWFGCVLGNALQYFSGDTFRCTTAFCQ